MSIFLMSRARLAMMGKVALISAILPDVAYVDSVLFAQRGMRCMQVELASRCEHRAIARTGISANGGVLARLLEVRERA